MSHLSDAPAGIKDPYPGFKLSSSCSCKINGTDSLESSIYVNEGANTGSLPLAKSSTSE